MFVVLFEVQPKMEQYEQYLELAKLLRPELERIDGFLDNERYRSASRSGVILSLSTWRDEKALIRWRTQALHHQVQEKGRFVVFLNYRLRVGEVTYDTVLSQGLVEHQQRFDETKASETKVVTLTEIFPSLENGKTIRQDTETVFFNKNAEGFVESDMFESISTPGKRIILAGWRDAQSAREERNVQQDERQRHREVRIIRSYGMFDRVETPQYYPEVQPSTTEALHW
jgi:heme-degrading monooxygenase HmoA